MLTPNGQLSSASNESVRSTHGGNSLSGDGQAELVDCLAVSVLRRQLSVGLIRDCECVEVAEFEQSIFDLITENNAFGACRCEAIRPHRPVLADDADADDEGVAAVGALGCWCVDLDAVVANREQDIIVEFHRLLSGVVDAASETGRRDSSGDHHELMTKPTSLLHKAESATIELPSNETTGGERTP